MSLSPPILRFKKGDLSINMIIVAVLALIVLVAAVYVFTSKINIFSSATGKLAHETTTELDKVTSDLFQPDQSTDLAGEAAAVISLVYDYVSVVDVNTPDPEKNSVNK